MAELNEYLMPTNSPITQAQPITAYDMSSDYDRSSVGAYNIKDFSFSSGRGGTLTLGGTANGTGSLYVYNAAGSLIVTINNNGINVTGGSITINNNVGTPVVDAYGVNSQNVFVNAAAINASSPQTVTGTTETALTGGTLTFITNRNNVNYVFLYTADVNLVESVGNTGSGFVRIRVDGVSYDPSINLIAGSSNDLQRNYMAHAFTMLNAGTHSLVLLAAPYSVTGTPSLRIGTYKLTYFALGQ